MARTRSGVPARGARGPVPGRAGEGPKTEEKSMHPHRPQETMSAKPAVPKPRRLAHASLKGAR